jgi:hypothetical protein
VGDEVLNDLVAVLLLDHLSRLNNSCFSIIQVESRGTHRFNDGAHILHELHSLTAEIVGVDRTVLGFNNPSQSFVDLGVIGETSLSEGLDDAV